MPLTVELEIPEPQITHATLALPRARHSQENRPAYSKEEVHHDRLVLSPGTRKLSCRAHPNFPTAWKPPTGDCLRPPLCGARRPDDSNGRFDGPFRPTFERLRTDVRCKPGLNSPNCRSQCKVKRGEDRVTLRQEESGNKEPREAEDHEAAQSTQLADFPRLRLNLAYSEKGKETSQVDEHKYEETNQSDLGGDLQIGIMNGLPSKKRLPGEISGTEVRKRVAIDTNAGERIGKAKVNCRLP